jgi:hypothetical protein
MYTGRQAPRPYAGMDRAYFGQMSKRLVKWIETEFTKYFKGL